jgi:hypothetical protein
MSRFRGFALTALALLVAAPAAAQVQTKYVAPSDGYTIGGFRYAAPTSDGWRQVASGGEALELVYLESLGQDQVNGRAYVAMQAAEIPGDSPVKDLEGLATLSRNQQMEARGDNLVAYSPTALVAGRQDMRTFRLVTSMAGEPDRKLFEVFYVALAPDISQYLVMNFATNDEDYENQLFFAQFFASLASVGFRDDAGDKAATAPAGDAAPAATGGDAP